MDKPEKEIPVKDTTNRDMAVRTQALDMAIRSNCGQCYDTNNHMVFDAEEVVKGAKLFEEFIKGIVNKPETKFEPKKEGW
jgi:hypothetical protein